MFGESNVDLLVPIAIMIAMVRYQPHLRLTTRLLAGLKFFVPRYFTVNRSTGSGEQSDRDVPIEEAIAKLNFTMAEVDGSKTTHVTLSAQSCFKLFETLVQLLLTSILSLLFSKIWHCALPTAVYSFWVPLALVVGLTVSLNGLFITADGEIAIPVAMVSFLAFLGLVYYLPFAVLPGASMKGLSLHVLGLVQQLSATPPITSRRLIFLAVKMILAIILSLLTAAMVTPARRVSQLLIKMTTGRPFERASKPWLLMLWVDYAMPLPMAFLFSSLVQRAMGDDCAGQVCANNSSAVLPRMLYVLQVLSVVGFIALKASVLKKYLQCWLDYSVEALTLSMVSKDMVIVSKLKATIEERSQYLMTAATQAIAVPLLCAFWLLIKLQSIPHSTGICYLTKSLLGMDTSDLLVAQQSFFAYNSTAVAFANASMPHLDDALYQTFGVSLMGPIITRGERVIVDRPTGVLNQFLVKLSQIYFPPAPVAADLINSGIFWTVCIWFLLTTGFLIRWLVDMQAMKNAAKEVI